MLNDEKYMQYALDLAFQGMGYTSPNPSVGAVIVKNDLIIGCGHTSECGGNHAEINALQSCTVSPENSEVYVTLEPCCHYGKTPPCTKALIEAKVKRVIIAVQDANSLVNGGGVKILKDQGVEVTILKSFERKSTDLLRFFNKYILQQRPFVLHKSAMTINGCTAASSGNAEWISNSSSRLLTHLLRCKFDAIVVGAGTVVSDNPSLNVRLPDFSNEDFSLLATNAQQIIGYQDEFIVQLLAQGNKIVEHCPKRIIVGFNNSIKKNFKVFADDNYLIYCTKDEAKFIPAGINNDHIFIAQKIDRAAQIEELLTILARKGIMSVMLEGGSKLVGSFYQAKMIDQVFYFKAPILLGAGIPVLQADYSKSVKEGISLKKLSYFSLNDDLVYSGYVGG